MEFSIKFSSFHVYWEWTLKLLLNSCLLKNVNSQLKKNCAWGRKLQTRKLGNKLYAFKPQNINPLLWFAFITRPKSRFKLSAPFSNVTKHFLSYKIITNMRRCKSHNVLIKIHFNWINWNVELMSINNIISNFHWFTIQ